MQVPLLFPARRSPIRPMPGPWLLAALATGWTPLQAQACWEQAAQRYEIQFWKRALYPFACLVMLALALPFAYKRAIDSMAVASGPALTAPPPEVSSAHATAWPSDTAAPTPNATASPPTRPTK